MITVNVTNEQGDATDIKDFVKNIIGKCGDALNNGLNVNINDEDCGCEDDNEGEEKCCCNETNEYMSKNDPYCNNRDDVKAYDKAAINFLILTFNDLSSKGIYDMFYAAKTFVHGKHRDLTCVDLSRETSRVMIELLDYIRALIDMDGGEL